MPSSVRLGSRPSAFRMRSYSSEEIPWSRSTSGVIVWILGRGWEHSLLDSWRKGGTSIFACWEGRGKGSASHPGLFVDLSTMGHSHNADHTFVVIYQVQNPPVSYADTPKVFVSFQLLTSGRPRMLRQRFDARKDAGENFIRQGIQLLASRRFEFQGVAIHATGRALSGLPSPSRRGFPSPCGATRR